MVGDMLQFFLAVNNCVSCTCDSSIDLHEGIAVPHASHYHTGVPRRSHFRLLQYRIVISFPARVPMDISCPSNTYAQLNFRTVLYCALELYAQILTDYNHLQDVVPNLVRNDILQSFDGDATEDATYDTEAPEEVQCRQVADQMKGAVMKQVGGAKVAGINFSARTTLEVREWPNGMPDFAHFKDDMWEGKSRVTRAKEYPTVPLTRYRFPRPFALSSLPTKDISMQSVVQDDGEFRLYQGVWRMQPLPGCAPPGKQAMRLTYAVEISPRAYLPVRLVEGRIVKDLCTNLEAIRKVVSTVPTKA